MKFTIKHTYQFNQACERKSQYALLTLAHNQIRKCSEQIHKRQTSNVRAFVTRALHSRIFHIIVLSRLSTCYISRFDCVQESTAHILSNSFTFFVELISMIIMLKAIISFISFLYNKKI